MTDQRSEVRAEIERELRARRQARGAAGVRLTCLACGAVCPSDARFCTGCGAQFNVQVIRSS